MLIHPDLILDQAHSRQHEMVAQADRYRLLSLARRHRKAVSAESAAARGRPASHRARVAAAR